MHLFSKVVGYFEDQRHFHDPYDSDVDSEFSEGEEMFDCPKRISKDNKRNASIATFTNIMQKNRSNPNKSMWNQRPILNMSGFAEISLKITVFENPHFPNFDTKPVANGCRPIMMPVCDPWKPLKSHFEPPLASQTNEIRINEPPSSAHLCSPPAPTPAHMVLV